LNGVSAGLAALAKLFYIVGCAGYASEEDAIKNTNWINYPEDVFVRIGNLYKFKD
jgi:hypothetical protein